ncbi:MAG: GH3 auxin-responsive promoter family protein, partial [Clostridiales bacterium]|nr:GH3 auxin-responsive promoter family protein [Clostridiales bacterium]
MKFQDKLKKHTREQLWSEYCGFLDLSVTDYMYIQNRLMDEQIRLWRDSGLGRELLHGKRPETVEEFRKMLPLTTYEDYADILLSRRTAMLPAAPMEWIETTWEGGLRPIKVAPYTREMLATYRHNIMCMMMVTTAREKGEICVAKGDRVLYGGAPLPYATGLMPSLVA